MIEVISEHSIPVDLDKAGWGMSIPVLWVSEFSAEEARDFFADFTALQSDDNVKHIYIYVDSFGGAIDSLSAMTELVESSKKTVSTVCVGKAMSAGGILTAIGTPGHRWIGPNSRLMLHRVSTIIGGDSDQIENITKELVRMNDMWLKKAVSRSKMTWKEFNDMLKAKGGEWYLTPTEAVKYGFADRIGTPMIREVRTLVAEVSNEKKVKTKKPARKKVKNPSPKRGR